MYIYQRCVRRTLGVLLCGLLAGCSSQSSNNPISTSPAPPEATAPNSTGAPPTLPDSNSSPKFVQQTTVQVTFPDGGIYIRRAVKQFSDDSLVNHGKYTSHHRNGQRFEEGEFVDGAKTGQWRLWYDNGQEAKAENYVNGKLDGQWTRYSRAGQRELDVSYRAGKRHGSWIFYRPDGSKEKQEEYRDELLDGTATVWFADGRKQRELHFVAGQPDGKQEEWYANGKQAAVIHYAAGKLHGRSTRWDEDGAILSDETFDNGKRKSGGKGS